MRHLYDVETLAMDLERSVSQLVQFEIDLVELTSKESSLKKLHVGDLPTDGRVDWIRAFRELFRGTNIEITEQEYVFYADGYVQRLISYINNSNFKTVGKFVKYLGNSTSPSHFDLSTPFSRGFV